MKIWKEIWTLLMVVCTVYGEICESEECIADTISNTIESIQEERQKALDTAVGDSIFFQYIPDVPYKSDIFDQIWSMEFIVENNWQDIFIALQDAIQSTYMTMQYWGYFIYLVSIPIAKLFVSTCELLLPHFMIAVVTTADYIQHMDPKYQLLLVGIIVLTYICYRQGYVSRIKRQYMNTRRAITSRYRQFIKQISEKSKIGALILPHAVFFLLVYFILYTAPTIVLGIVENDFTYTLLAIIVPLVSSFRVLYKQRMNTITAALENALNDRPLRYHREKETPKEELEKKQREWRNYEYCLQFWTLWALWACLVSMVTLFIPQFVLSYVDLPQYIRIILLAWIHLPITRGDIVLYSVFSPIVNPYANRIKDVAKYKSSIGDNSEEDTSQNMLMRSLVAFGVLKEQYVHVIRDVWSQGPSLAGLMFLFTPGFVTARGCYLMGFGFPAYLTLSALAGKSTRRYDWWLLYFTVAVTTNHVFNALELEIGWFPFFYHAKLLVIIWLQFPYFRGASRIFETIFSSVFVAAQTKEINSIESKKNQ